MALRCVHALLLQNITRCINVGLPSLLFWFGFFLYAQPATVVIIIVVIIILVILLVRITDACEFMALDISLF